MGTPRRGEARKAPALRSRQIRIRSTALGALSGGRGGADDRERIHAFGALTVTPSALSQSRLRLSAITPSALRHHAFGTPTSRLRRNDRSHTRRATDPRLGWTQRRLG